VPSGQLSDAGGEWRVAREKGNHVEQKVSGK